MDLRAIDHTTLYVHSLDAIYTDYQDILGLDITKRDDALPTLSVENSFVHFFIVEDKSVSQTFVEKQHISFNVPSLEKVIENLTSNDIRFETGIFSGFKTRNYKWCEWRDKAGIRLECVETI